MAVNREDLAYDSKSGHLRGTVASGETPSFLNAKLTDVLPGSVVQVTVSGSARGQFYYGPIEVTGAAQDLCASWRVFSGGSPWYSLETSTFYATPAGTGAKVLSFTIKLEKGDLSGEYDLYNLSLMARVV